MYRVNHIARIRERISTRLMATTVDHPSPPVSGLEKPASTVFPDSAASLGRTVNTRLPRELGRVIGGESGPTLICLGGLHGNEPAGVEAIRRVLLRLEEQESPLRGELIGLVGNRQALTVGCRFIDHDLNRAWHPERLSRLLKSTGHAQAEDREQLELDAALQRIMDEASGRVFLLDLHTVSGPGSAFAILDDTLPNREIALDFPVPLVLGLEEELSGTLASYLTTQGVTVLGFEAGQHDDPTSIDRAEAAVWLALDSCGLAGGSLRQRALAARQLLTTGHRSVVRIVEVLGRHPIAAGDAFRMLPGFASFQKVSEGQLLARESGRPVLATKSGMLLMPLYQDQGEDGFFLVREIHPGWLNVSARLRRWHLERMLPWLPGVSRDPDRPETFVVDRRWARWFALHLFHLLGFRREGKEGPILIMTRRRDTDT